MTCVAKVISFMILLTHNITIQFGLPEVNNECKFVRYEMMVVQLQLLIMADQGVHWWRLVHAM